MSDKGLYQKYEVVSYPTIKGRKSLDKIENTTGRFFVLKPDKDTHAINAIEAYAQSCRDENSELALDLLTWACNARAAIKEAGDEPN